MTNSRLAPPKASAMLEALRGMGYSLGAALADIIDNSISAQAEKVRIDFIWNGQDTAIRILDDGQGMTADELESAMILGGRNPLDDRSQEDLGRFGLGLKTASFSQCRRLTVASRKHGVTSVRRWDLDFIASSTDQGWHLLDFPASGSSDLLTPLERQDDGTLVLWECLDRVVTPGFTDKDFLEQTDLVEQHLAMVFHRFLDSPNARLRLFINGEEAYQQIKPWDPFLSSHPATISTPSEVIGQGVRVKGFILPHKDRLKKKELDDGAGPRGWVAQQGFYVYRNERLLVAGSWLGLGQGRAWTKEEAHKLARIRLDLITDCP